MCPECISNIPALMMAAAGLITSGGLTTLVIRPFSGMKDHDFEHTALTKEQEILNGNYKEKDHHDDGHNGKNQSRITR